MRSIKVILVKSHLPPKCFVRLDDVTKMCRDRRDFRMRLCEIRRIICVLETWGYVLYAGD
jgi:hypothetical protein